MYSGTSNLAPARLRPPSGAQPWRSIEARLSELQVAEDAIKARLAAQDSGGGRTQQHPLAAAAAPFGSAVRRPGDAHGLPQGPQPPGGPQQPSGALPAPGSSSPSRAPAAAAAGDWRAAVEPTDEDAPFGTDRNAKVNVHAQMRRGQKRGGCGEGRKGSPES